jgi:carbamoyltransferase
MTTNILGISAYYHDSAAALVQDGKILAAAQEERFSRKKHDPKFPKHAIAYCLKEAGLKLQDLSQIVFYDKPILKFERLLETYLAYSPQGFTSFLSAMPVWMKEKLFLKTVLKRELAELAGCKQQELPPLLFTEHHQAHAASAFFPSPFERAAVLCLDGVGEWATTSVWLGSGNQLTPQWEIGFPHSLGLLYSAFTYYTGFKVNSGEYKLMGLAPYGEPKYVNLIFNHLLDLKPDGSFRLDMSYFNFAIGLTMTNRKFNALFGGEPRQPEAKLTQREMDIASSIQVVTEEIVLRLCRTVKQELAVDHLCLAGGVALNCVANGYILREGIFKDIWIQPAAGDAGGAIGAALSVWYQYLQEPRQISEQFSVNSELLSTNNYQSLNGNSRSAIHYTLPAIADHMQGAYLGPRFSNTEIRDELDGVGAIYQHIDDAELFPYLAELLEQGNVLGWFQGRMEFGPRALGGRSIIGDARNPKMQSVMNLKIKYRESFRPFAPSVLAERVSDYFELDRPSPYMLIVASIKESLRHHITPEQDKLFGIEKLLVARSQIPAVTHVDYSARIQTIHKETNPRYHALLTQFESRTGCAVLVNTSFNVRGEPIVCTPKEAYQCFMRTEMDYLVLENCVLAKQQQPKLESDRDWQKEFELD